MITVAFVAAVVVALVVASLLGMRLISPKPAERPKVDLWAKLARQAEEQEDAKVVDLRPAMEREEVRPRDVPSA